MTRDMIDAVARTICVVEFGDEDDWKSFVDHAIAVIRTLAPAIVDMAAGEAKKAVSTDTDWDNSYWNQCAEGIAHRIHALKDVFQ